MRKLGSLALAGALLAGEAAGEQGMVGFTLDVGADGRVTGCNVTRSSHSATLDSATCSVMQSRARFTPATDAGGAPVPDKVSGRIIWKLPAAPPAPAP